MNETHNIMYWMKFLIAVEPTLQYTHIDHNHEMLIMNDVCGGKKLNFYKK